MRLLYIGAAIAALLVVGHFTSHHPSYPNYNYGDTPKYDGGSYGSDIKYGDAYSFDGDEGGDRPAK